MEIKKSKAVLILLALPSLVLSVSLPVPRKEPSSVMLAIPSANILLHGQFRLAGRFQYFTSAELGSIDPSLNDSSEAPLPKEVQSLNYNSELLFGIENRAEFGIQYGREVSFSVKALLVREDIFWPDLVFGVRNLFSSPEAGLYGVATNKVKKNLQSESYATFAKSFASKTRAHLGMSVLTHATKGYGSLNAGIEQDLGRGASFGYEVFERFSDFHQIFSFQWKYRNLVGLSIGMTEFQSWIRQGGRWGFFLTPSHPLRDGYNSPGITVALQVNGWVPHRDKRTLSERVAILEVKNAQLEKQVEGLEELRNQMAEIQANGSLPAPSSTVGNTASGLPVTNGAGNSQVLTELARMRLSSISEKLQSDLSDPNDIRELIFQMVAMGQPAWDVVNQVVTDTSSNLRVPAVLVMASSRDTSFIPRLKVLCADSDPQIRRESLTALYKLSGKQILDTARIMLSDLDPTVAMTAGEVYRQITGQAPPSAKNAAPVKKLPQSK